MTLRSDYPPLEETLMFSPADLDANRGGRLTDEQRDRLQRSEITLNLVMTAASILLYVVLFYIITFSLAISLLILAVLLVVMGLPLIRRSLKLLDDMRAARVEQVSGTVEHKTRIAPWRRYSRLYFIDVTTDDGATERFTVRREVYQSFDAGARYRVYYLPDSRQMVAAEPA